MSEPISPKQFHEAEGIEDWHVVGDGACAFFRTSTFEEGADLVQALAGLGSAPDVDVRPDGVTVKLVHLSDEHWGLIDDHIDSARQISALIRDLGLTADPSMLQSVQVTLAAHVSTDVMPFWKAVLDYSEVGEEDLIDPRGRGAPFWFMDLPKAPTRHNRFHIDVFVPHDQIEARVQAALAAGGRILNDSGAPGWWSLEDPEGNVADLATMVGRG